MLRTRAAAAAPASDNRVSFGAASQYALLGSAPTLMPLRAQGSAYRPIAPSQHYEPTRAADQRAMRQIPADAARFSAPPAGVAKAGLGGHIIA